MNSVLFKIFFLLSLVFSTGLLSCTKDEPIENDETPSKRTILVYMVANNNLSSYADKDIVEMQNAAKYYDLNGGRLIIYHASVSGLPALKEITSEGISEIKTYSNDTYSTDTIRLKQVIADVKRHAPASDYGLILWSHSDAWRETADAKSINSNNVAIKPLSFGVDRNKKMKVSSLAKVLNQHYFSFIYFDCCHMASIEVAYELRHATDYIIGSGTELPANGMPYNVNIPLLFADEPKLEQACKNTFDYYNDQIGTQKSCTMSLIATKHLDELANVSREIFAAGIFSASSNIQTYIRQREGFPYDFLFDMQEYMQSISPDDDTFQRWNSALNQVVLYKNNTPTIFGQLSIDRYCGLGCHIINDISDAATDGYNNQCWWTDVVSYHFK